MYYFTKNGQGRIVHTLQCRYMRAISEVNLGSIEHVQDVYLSGKRFCKCCSPIVDRFKAEETEVMDYCAKNGLACRLNGRALQVWTCRSRWQIVAADNRVGTMLYHKNEVKRAGDERSLIQGYHNQQVCYDRILSYLTYIYEHDSFRMVNPLISKPKKKGPPRKGTKRYRKQQKREANRARYQSISRVMQIFDKLQRDSERAVG